MDLIVLIVLIVVVAGTALAARQRSRSRELTQRREALVPVRKLAFEDITAFGEDLAKLDVDISGRELDEGAIADYQRALDDYDAAKVASDSMTEPEDVRKLIEIIEDGRYAISCVRARLAGDVLPSRRPPCFFDPRHGPSVADVPFTLPDGTEREVPACALDAERVRAGAEPDSRKVLVNGQRVPYWDGGRAFQPYAMGYFGADALTWLFIGSLAFDGYGDGFGGDTSAVSGGDGAGESSGDDAGAASGGGDGGGWDLGGDF